MSFLRQNSFFKIVSQQQEENTIIFQIQFNQNHEIYEGHFPVRAVTPGVCTIQIVKELIELTTQKKLTLQSAGNIKFTGMVDPTITNVASFKINYVVSGKEISANATVYQESHTFCKFSGIYLEK